MMLIVIIVRILSLAYFSLFAILAFKNGATMNGMVAMLICMMFYLITALATIQEDKRSKS